LATAGSAGGTGTALPLRFIARPGKATKAGLAGLVWVAWPCAALQAGLVLSAMASSPAAGALVMGAFALGSMPVLAFGPWVWTRWQAWVGHDRASPSRGSTLAYRVAGAGLVMAAGWALTHGLWERVAAWCVS
jgi:sulfite exporter TauE/SafE